MPKMSGDDAIRRIREKDSLRTISVLAVSARGVVENFFTDRSNAEFIAKPFDDQELPVYSPCCLKWENTVE